MQCSQPRQRLLHWWCGQGLNRSIQVSDLDVLTSTGTWLASLDDGGACRNIQILSRCICFSPLNDPILPLTFTTVPMSIPFRSIGRPVLVTPSKEMVGFAIPALGMLWSLGLVVLCWDRGRPQVTSITAPLLSSRSIIQRVGNSSKATITPTRRIHFIGWLRWK